MPLSRVRLRLAGGFALAFLIGLLLLSLSLYVFTVHRDDGRLRAMLTRQGDDLVAAIRREYAENRADGFQAGARAAIAEWPTLPSAFSVYDSVGTRVAVAGDTALITATPGRLARGSRIREDVPGAGEHRIRLLQRGSTDPAFSVVVASSLATLDEDDEALMRWLGLSVPLTALLSLIAGYLFSRRALRPVTELEHSIAGIAPDGLHQRVPLSSPPDEVGRVAVQFNALLARLEESRAQNRRFVEEAAHQIRTPLTLVMGETDLALDHDATGATRADALRRIRLAARQMDRRVSELLLLARADAGERAPMTDAVELDGLALEAVDLMRGRAQALGRRLELGAVEPLTVQGSASLLREAVLELLENACRHGSGGAPVALGVARRASSATVTVTNGVDVELATAHRGTGLGLQVVAWIAREHGGSLVREAEDGHLTFGLELPDMSPSGGPAR